MPGWNTWVKPRWFNATCDFVSCLKAGISGAGWNSQIPTVVKSEDMTHEKTSKAIGPKKTP